VGLINSFLSDLFGVRPRWLDSPTLAFGLVVFAAVWKNVGYNVAFYIAAIQNLPRDVLEAARIDGASSTTMFWRILFPLLSPMTFFLVFANLTYALFDSFGLVDILTRGGPVAGSDGATSFLIFPLYTDSIENYKTGFGAALAVIQFVADDDHYLWPLVIIRDEAHQVVQVGLKGLSSAAEGQNWGIVMAGAVVSIIAPLIVFTALQEQFSKGFALGTDK